MKVNLMPEQKQPPSALSIIGQIRRGQLVEELSELVAALSRDVVASRKAGSITIKLVVRPSKLAENGVEMADSVSVKVPPRETKPTLFFASAEGALTRDDPRQGELPINVVGIRTKDAEASAG